MHLTYLQNELLHGTVVSDDSEAAGAPVTKIEITPEMIEAGTSEFWAFDERFEFAEEAVVRIYRAMCLHRKPR